MNPFDVFDEDRPRPTRKPEAPSKHQRRSDHTEAKLIYAQYLEKKTELEKLRKYADEVAKATHSPGMTPVMPLATMNRGGALLCDYCSRLILLEGGRFNNVYVDYAWKANPDPKWKSWIKGGMVVEIAENGTLRIYHGSPGSKEHCCNLAPIELERQRALHKLDQTKIKLIVSWLEDKGRENELSDIVNVMFAFDPGLGVNRPC